MSIVAHRKVRTLLEGQYGSVFKGRGLEFEDLRQYELGDNVKDIDWRATARSGQVLIKQYIATRKHNIIFLTHTGRAMACKTPLQETKSDVAIMSMGVLAFLAHKHGDRVGLIYGNNNQTKMLPLRGGMAHIEGMLRTLEDNTKIDSPNGDMKSLLAYASKHISHRSMLVIITDDLDSDEETNRYFRRLSAQHEVMVINIGDLSAIDESVRHAPAHDIEDGFSLPEFIRGNKNLEAVYTESLTSRLDAATRMLERLRISNVEINGDDEVIPQIFRLLERQKHAKA